VISHFWSLILVYQSCKDSIKKEEQMYDLSGKVALVTGTANKRGIGRYIALRLAEEGADIVVSDIYRTLEELDPWDRDEGWRGLESLVAEIEAMGRRVVAIPADVTKSQEVDAMVKKTVKEFGGIDILVNNAGLISRFIGLNPMVEMSDETWDKVIAVNLTGLFHVSRAVAREMIKRNQKGKIINIASVAGKRGMAGRSAYGTSKFGVVGLTQIMALELAQHQINVNAVCPGIVATWGPKGAAIYEGVKSGMSEEEAIEKAYVDSGQLQQVPMGRLASIDDVVKTVAFFASDQSDYMTGQAVNVCGGWLMAH